MRGAWPPAASARGALAQRRTNDHLVHLVEQVHDELDLVRHLGAAEDGEKRPRGRVERLGKVVELLLQQEAAQALRQLHADHARVRAVRRAKGVVDVDVAQLGQRRRKRGDVVLGRLELGAVGLHALALLGHVEPQVFQQQHRPRRGRRARRLGRRAHAVLHKRHRHAQRPLQHRHARTQRVLGRACAQEEARRAALQRATTAACAAKPAAVAAAHARLPSGRPRCDISTTAGARRGRPASSARRGARAQQWRRSRSSGSGSGGSGCCSSGCCSSNRARTCGRALLQRVLNRRQRRVDALRVGNFGRVRLVQRHVKVDADELPTKEHRRRQRESVGEGAP